MLLENYDWAGLRVSRGLAPRCEPESPEPHATVVLSPTETSREPDLLEHPAEAFGYYRYQGIARVICEEKHMGSRAVVIVCRDRDAARKRFGIVEEVAGICYTRTGRRFFEDATLEAEFISRLQSALAGF